MKLISIHLNCIGEDAKFGYDRTQNKLKQIEHESSFLTSEIVVCQSQLNIRLLAFSWS